MATNPILGRDVYLALAAVGWADGQLTDEAADAIVRTALEEGLDLEDIGKIEEATKHKVEVGEIDMGGLTKADRLYVYAVASWISQLDGPPSSRHQGALTQLGDALQIPEAPRIRADEIMQGLASEADRPDRFDLRSLRRTLDERHREARQVRLEKAIRGEE